MGAIRLAEAGGTLAPAAGGKGHLFRARLIEGDRLGSSGYYPADVIRRDGPSIFAEGTHCYLDHPGQTERYERPERSVRDLAGVIASTPVYEGDGLYADVRVYPLYGDVIEAMSDDIGMSIRAAGTFEWAEVDGERVKRITALTAAESVDFVTKAGAGGKITALIESARAGLVEATANDTREALDGAVAERFGGGEDTYTWIRDFDDTTVWYQISGPDTSATYAVGYTADDDLTTLTLADDPVEVRVHTEYVPVNSAGGSTTTQEAETPGGDMPKIELDEAEVTRLRESDAALTEARRVAAEEKTRADKAEATIAESGAKDDARTRATAIVKDEPIREATKTRIVESVLAGLPMADGKLDVAAFESRVKDRAKSEATYEASLLAEAGVGKVTGNGTAPAGGGDTVVTEAERITKRESDFRDLGLSEAEAKIAAAGRN